MMNQVYNYLITYSYNNEIDHIYIQALSPEDACSIVGIPMSDVLYVENLGVV